jgi:uncharacterized protein
MQLGIISDTHDNLEQTRKAVQKFRELEIGLVIHAGDFCSPFSVLEFEGFEFHAVFGNNDGDHYRILAKMQEIGGHHHGEFMALKLDGTHIAVYHGTQAAITDALIKCGTYNVVISGHTHTAHIEKHGNTLHINPGSAHGFGHAGTITTLDPATREASVIKL